MTKKKVFTIKLPRRILCIPALTNIIVTILFSFFLFLLFFSLSFLEGLKSNIKTNTIKNYTSHLSIYAQNYSDQQAKSINTWWIDNDPTIENLPNNNSYIRAIVPRSTIPVIFSNSNSSQPLQLTLVNNKDDLVFDNFMSPTTNTIIAIDRIYLSKKFAQKHNITNGQHFPIYIPTLNLYYTNLVVDYFYEAPDSFKDQFSAYINKLSITNLETKFQQYNLRFLATPFISIIEPSIAPLIDGYKKITPDMLLEYQYSQLNYIRNQIYKWIYFFYAISGLMFLLLHFFAYSDRKLFLNYYTYRTGFIPTLSPFFRLFRTVIFKILLITILALLGIIGLLNLPLEFDSRIFVPKEFLYPQYLLPIMKYFRLQIPWTLITQIPIGIFIGIASASLILFIFHLLPNFSNPKNTISYIILGMITVSLFGFFSSYSYIEANFFKKSRNRFWSQQFFGKYMLSDKDYHVYKSFDLNPHSITIPIDNFKILEEQEVRYLATLEYQGTAKTLVNSPTADIEPQYNIKDVYIKSLTGNLTQFSNILEPLKDQQIVIGKEIADYFLTNKVLTISLLTSSNEIIEFPIVVASVIDNPIGDFNNTIFINHTNLTSQLKIAPDQFTKFQILGNKKFIMNLTNSKVSLLSLNQNTKYWNHLSDLVIASIGLTALIQGIYFGFFVLAIILYLTLNKQKIIISHLWATIYNPISKYSLLSFGSFIIGICMTWIVLLIKLFWNQELPSYLSIPSLTNKTISVIPNWSAVPLLILGFMVCHFIIYSIFQYIFKRIVNKIIKNHYKDQLS